MTTIPLIGLSGRRTHGHRQEGYAQELHHLDLDLYFADYARAIIEAGGLPVHLPIDVDPGLATKRLDGVLLTGGADIDPIRFDAGRHPEVTMIERERDAFEFALLGEALHHEVPVLGICRGMQVINVHLGGTLNQHIPEHSRYDVGSSGFAHSVKVDDGSILCSLYGESVDVNSLHHQTIDRIGDGLTVTARADDGTIEGMESGDTIVAVQWHPEMMDGRPDDPLFRWIVERTRR
jgi:putative glutamine amidotransferase